jgi:AraC-like DNA-binding protein
MLTEFDSAPLNARDRISVWRDAVATSLVEVECRPFSGTEFSGSFLAFSANGCGLATLAASGHTAARPLPCINRSGDDFFMLFLQRQGVMAVDVANEEMEIRPGDFFFYNGQIPHRLSFTGPFEHVALRLPRTAIDQRWRSLRSRGCFRLTPRDALSRIAAATLDAAATDIRALSSDDLQVAIENVIDLFAAGSAKILSEGGAANPDPSSVPFARARAVIRARLSDDSLTPDAIAAALRISRRSLNKLFEKQGIGVMEYVLLERLEQAARDLSSPSHRSESVTEIAYRWGFKNSSHFCRRFRDHFGRSPSESRTG